jgi:hypothetical protein
VLGSSAGPECVGAVGAALERETDPLAREALSEAVALIGRR